MAGHIHTLRMEECLTELKKGQAELLASYRSEMVAVHEDKVFKFELLHWGRVVHEQEEAQKKTSVSAFKTSAASQRDRLLHTAGDNGEQKVKRGTVRLAEESKGQRVVRM